MKSNNLKRSIIEHPFITYLLHITPKVIAEAPTLILLTQRFPFHKWQYFVQDLITTLYLFRQVLDLYFPF